MFELGEKRRDVVLVPSPRIRFGPPAEKTGPETGEGGGRVGPGRSAEPSTRSRPGDKTAGPPGKEEEENPPGEGGGGSAAGSAGSGTGTGSSLSRGFSLVFPADAMINLAKYTETPEDALLRPYRLAKTGVNFSKYVYPGAGTRGAVAGPGGPGGRFEPVKPGGSSGVMVSVPDNVRRYDLSAWADVVLSRIQSHWKVGREKEIAWAGKVGIQVHLMKAGDVTMVEILEPSKIDVLDEAARRAIELAAPFPPLPDDFPFSSLEILFMFRYGR